MAGTYYAQSDRRPKTLTVGELIAELCQLDPSKPVVFRSPQYGCFGSGTEYSIDTVFASKMDRREETIPACTGYDDETGEPYEVEAWTQVFHEWEGVVIG